MSEIICVGNPLLAEGYDGRHREYQFEYGFNGLDRSWDFRVRPVAPMPSNGPFDYRVRLLADGSLQSWVMAHHEEPAFRRTGVSNSIIYEASRVLGREIVSSVNNGVPGEFRQPGATKAWLRLVASGKAIHDAATDEYRTV